MLLSLLDYVTNNFIFFTMLQVLKEVIEQRTKVVEEAIAANSVHLQNRIRELERQNRELRWSARKLSDAFKNYVAKNEKVNLLRHK